MCHEVDKKVEFITFNWRRFTLTFRYIRGRGERGRGERGEREKE
jgi:hypothetical protein